MNKITVVGCGIMGSSLVNALLNGGFDVVVVDLNKDNAEPFIARGAQYAKNLSDAPETECILLNLPANDIAKAVVTGCSVERLSGKILINTTTNTPAEVKELAAVAKDYGLRFLEAKIEHYPGQVGPDTGYFVYSGDKDAFTETEHMLKALGKAIYLGSDIKAASVTDLAVLGVHFGAFAAMVEGAAFCIKNDYPIAQYVEQTAEILPLMLQGNYAAVEKELSNYDGTFEDAGECSLEIETHAVAAVKNAMNDDGVKTPYSDTILKMFEKAVADGYGKKDMVAIIKEMI